MTERVVAVELFLFQSGKGWLYVRSEGRSEPIQVKLAGRLARCVVLLQNAREVDEARGLPFDIGGYRVAADLAEVFDADFPGKFSAIQATTVTHYLSELGREIRRQGAAWLFDALIERADQMGTRLRHPVKMMKAGGGTE